MTFTRSKLSLLYNKSPITIIYLYPYIKLHEIQSWAAIPNQYNRPGVRCKGYTLRSATMPLPIETPRLMPYKQGSSAVVIWAKPSAFQSHEIQYQLRSDNSLNNSLLNFVEESCAAPSQKLIRAVLIVHSLNSWKHKCSLHFWAHKSFASREGLTDGSRTVLDCRKFLIAESVFDFRHPGVFCVSQSVIHKRRA